MWIRYPTFLEYFQTWDRLHPEFGECTSCIIIVLLVTGSFEADVWI